MTPFIIPIFITHQGCPHRCIFCNQESISGSREGSFTKAEEVRLEINQWLQRPGAVGREVQVAFYGGSFTGLPDTVQQELLAAVRPYVDCGKVQSIRLSTRPDYIDGDTARFLYGQGVRTVELGIQSLDANVLKTSRRGHDVEQVEKAFVYLKKAPIKIGGQLMIGLPGETIAGVIKGAGFLAGLRPDFVRIYPTLVVRGSALQKVYEQGGYQPLSLLKAVAVAARMKEIFDAENIKIIRMGLQHSTDLLANIVAGPYHPSFGELVKARLLFKKVRGALTRGDSANRQKMVVAARDRSIFNGQKNCSMKRLQELGLLDGVELVFDNSQPRGEIRITQLTAFM